MTSTRSLPSRLAVLSITCILIICIFSCEKDPISSTLPEDTYTLVETKMLGSDGGEIVADELTLTVPPLAFNSSTEIKIYSSTIDKPFEEDHLSKSYRIEGLPFDSDVPLKISIKYSNSSSGDNSLAMGEETLSGEYSYRFLESIDSNGYVTGEIPVPDRDLGKISLKKIDGDGKFILTVAIISGYTSYLSAQGHCLITLPLAHTNNINNLAEFLEEAYQKYLDMGFSYGKRTNWPLNVTIKKPTVDGIAYRSKWGFNHGWMEFSVDALNDLLIIHVTAGHEFFHVVQSFYDSRWFDTRWASIRPNHYWFDEASATWIEEKFTNIANYSPAVRAGNKEAPLDGMQMYPSNIPSTRLWDNGDSIVQNHGYGMSAIVKYLVTKYGEDILLKIYKDLRSGKHVV